MSSEKEKRKDKSGQIISKDNCKNYHITISDDVAIIDVKSYKLFNKIRDEEYYDEDEFFDEEEEKPEEEKNPAYLDQRLEYEDCSSRDPMAFSGGGCSTF